MSKRALQFEVIGRARADLMEAAAQRSIPLHRVEFAVPFVETDFGLSVTLFFERSADIASCAEDGHTNALEGLFIESLVRHDYPEEWRSLVAFKSADSHENVLNRYEGSYFNRMR